MFFNDDCDCEDCLDPCGHHEELLKFKRARGLSLDSFTGTISEQLNLIAREPRVIEPQFLFFKGDRVIVSGARGSFEDEGAREIFIRSMKSGWIYFEPEALLWYAEAWASESESVLSGGLRARDCPERYEVIAANAYHVASRWRLHVEMKVEGVGPMRKVVSAQELDVFDEVGLRIMGRLGEGGAGLTH